MLDKRIINTATGAAAACTTDTVQILDETPFESIATYQLDGNANDLTTNYNGTWGGTEAYTTGQFGQAAVFNGSSSRIATGLTLPANSTMSFSFWLKSASNSSGNNYFLSDFDSSASNNSSRLSLAVSSNNGFRIWISNGSSNWNSTDAIDLSNYVGLWMHLAVVLNGTDVKVYINGGAPTTLTSSVAFGTAGSRQQTIGRAGDLNGAYYEGSIDQVRIYNKALSADNVATLYAETVATASTNITFDAPSLVAYYKMSDATDETGSYDGTPTNVNFNVAGKFGNAGEFNGSSSKIITSADFDGSTSGGWSISFWFNTTQTTAKALFGSNTIQGGASQGSTVYLGAASGSIADESISFWDFNGSTTSVFYAKGGSTYYQDGNWHHCTIISSSSSKEIWIDGVSQTIYYYSSGSVSANAKLTDLIIGDDNTGGGFNFNGKLDQVRVFNRAITANEVETLYDEVQCIPTIVPTDYFEPVIYTGNGTTQSITSLDFQPDLVWFKNRDDVVDHKLYDSIRGATKTLESSTTDAEGINANGLSSFDVNGFTVGGSNSVNGSGDRIVAWNFKAGGAAVTNTDGTITSQVSANTDAGFSIVKWAGSDTNDTVGHGLSVPPEMIIFKNIDQSTGKWATYNHTIGNTKTLYLNESSAEATAGFWQNTSPTNSVFYVSGQDTVNGPQGDIIAYCFHSVDGYSKIGSYIGTGAAGNSIVTGFRPAFVMIKRTDTSGSGWGMFDNVRGGNLMLRANADVVETDGNNSVSFTSNGFTLPETGVTTNASGGTYIYLAIA